jgi:hypothetical protein
MLTRDWMLAVLVDAINAIWDHRAELRPVSSSPNTALDIWTQLPDQL